MPPDPCSQPAAVITNTDGYPRFCLNHTQQAAALALQHHAFGGWWRITSHHYGDQLPNARAPTATRAGWPHP